MQPLSKKKGFKKRFSYKYVCTDPKKLDKFNLTY